MQAHPIAAICGRLLAALDVLPRRPFSSGRYGWYLSGVWHG